VPAGSSPLQSGNGALHRRMQSILDSIEPAKTLSWRNGRLHNMLSSISESCTYPYDRLIRVRLTLNLFRPIPRAVTGSVNAAVNDSS
jgi:hypothetical protein